MVLERQLTFWVAVLAAFIAAFWRLREIMLPFVAGAVLAYLLGFVGFLIAIPLAAAIAVLVRFALRQYLANPLYTGEEAARLP